MMCGMRPQTTVMAALVAALSLAVPWAEAIGPHQVALIVRRGVPASRRVADHYARLRSVPAVNIVAVTLPDNVDGGREIGPDACRTHILRQVDDVLKARGIAPYIHAWIYSAGFPVRVSSSPPTSLTGFTFVRGRCPPSKQIEDGLWASPLYAGPRRYGGTAHHPQTFDVSALWLGADMPVPAMMLGVTGERGNSVEEIEAYLSRGAAGDGTNPTGAVVLVRSDDIRTQCREWQFDPAVDELRKRGVDARVTSRLPPRGTPLAGAMTGMAAAEPAAGGPYRPGCIADNLTSFGAVFEIASQTKLTAWLRAGATCSAGTVTEPRSIWTKFPTARVFAHHAAGCTAIESYYLATGHPLQLLIVGDPLSAPWAPRDVRLALSGLSPDESVVGRIRLALTVKGPGAWRYRWFDSYVDGRPVGQDNLIWLDADTLSPGPHTCRAVARTTGFVRQQVFREVAFCVKERVP